MSEALSGKDRSARAEAGGITSMTAPVASDIARYLQVPPFFPYAQDDLRARLAAELRMAGIAETHEVCSGDAKE